MSSGEIPVRQLRQRWLDPRGQLLANEVLGRLADGVNLDGLPLGQVAGRVDLRGLPAPGRVALTPVETVRLHIEDGIELRYQLANFVGGIEFNGVELRDLDFSAATLPHVKVRGTLIENCIFDYANCGRLILVKSVVRHCTFVGGRFEVSFGITVDGQYNRLEQADFTRANLSGSSCGTASFVDCDFSHADLENVNFWQADLIRCRFAGVLRNVIFDGRVLEPEEKSTGNPMEEVDMTGVTAFEGGGFRGVNFDRVHLPDDPSLVVIGNPEYWIPNSLAKIEGREDLAARIVRSRLKQKEKMELRPDAGGHSFVNLGRIDDSGARELMSVLIADFGEVVQRPPGSEPFPVTVW